MLPFEVTPLLCVAIPFFGAFVIGLAGKSPHLRETATMVTALLLVTCVAELVPQALQGRGPSTTIAEFVPGIPLAFHVEPMGMIYALIASALWILNSLYSIGYMRAVEKASISNHTRFFVCFALSLACVMGIAFAANMMTLFFFYEGLSLATYPLVVHKASPEAASSGRTYVGLLVGTSVAFMLPAMVATWAWTGTLDFTEGGVFRQALTSGALHPAMFGVIFALFVYGIGKAALMPLHRWLPAAMVAPTPVSALLHAVAVVKAGVFAVIKVTVYLVGVDTLRGYEQGGWLVYVAGAAILVASFIALFQDNLKKRLAYSTISQLSYITMAVGLLTPLGIKAAAMHVACHAFGKITLFFAAGSIYTATHKTEISTMDGVGRRMPYTMAAFTIGAVSMIGLPPTAGFLSKWYLIGGAWQAEQVFVIVVVTLSTLLNAAYFLPIIYRAFFCTPRLDDSHDHGHGHGHGAGQAQGHGHGHHGGDERATSPHKLRQTYNTRITTQQFIALGYDPSKIDDFDHKDPDPEEAEEDHGGEAPWPIVLATCATAVLTLFTFFEPSLFLRLAQLTMEAINP